MIGKEVSYTEAFLFPWVDDFTITYNGDPSFKNVIKMFKNIRVFCQKYANRK